MWEGDYTDEAELEDWAAAIDWHSTGFLQDSGGASTTSSCASHDDSADNRGRRTAINTFEVDVSGKTNNDPPNDPPRLVGGGACSHVFFEEMDGWLLLGLPEELQLEVLSLLSPRELATVGAVCRRLRGLVNGERSLRKSLVGLPERYLVFRPRIPLADLEQSPQPQAHQHLVLDYLRDEGFLFVSLDEEDARVVRDFKKCATAYLAGLEERSQGRRKKMQYSKKAGSRSPVGYAEMDELHGYLTRRHKKKTFPWPRAAKKEKELARRYWGIMTRVVAGLLRNVADSLGIPQAMLLSLLQSDPSQEEAWLIERIERKSSNPGSLADRQPASPKVLLSVGKTQGVRTNTSAAHEWNQPVLKMFHFREGQPIRPNFRTMHEYSRGLFKLATAFNDGSTPCGMQMLMPRAPNASHRNFLPLFKLARENDICVFAGFSLSKLCQVFSGPMGIRPVYLTANVGYDYPAAPSGSACIQFDAHVSYPRLHHIIEQAAATRGILWSQPVSERFRCTNREFFNKKNPFGAFWFRSLNRKDNTKPLPKKVKWIVVGGAMACVAVPLVVVASPIWLPVGGMVWVCRERAAIRADAAER